MIRATPVVALAVIAASARGQDTRRVTEPTVPRVCAVVDARLAVQGAGLTEADERRADTGRIQQAMNQCPHGQAVALRSSGPHNAFLSGPLELKTGVTLLVDRGVTLFASRNPRDYDMEPGVCGTITARGHGCRPLIHGEGVSGAGVMGDGIIDGRGGAKLLGLDYSWWDLAEKARQGGIQNNPRLLVLSHSDDFTLYRIQLRNSPNFHVYYGNGRGFTAWGVTINAPRNARNTDGIDPANSTDVTIAHCFIHTGDDNVAIKAPAGAPTARMTIAHNHFYAGHGMSIGSETDGGASSILVEDLSIDGADNGLRIKSNVTRGGLVRDVTYKDVCIRDTKNPILMDSNYTASVSESRDKPPQFTAIRMENVRVLGGGKITLDGYDTRHRLGIRFDNVVVDDPAAIKVGASHAEIVLGPGPANFRPAGEDVTLSGAPGEGKPNACAGKFVPFPVPVSVK
jgi:polygalacturonase